MKMLMAFGDFVLDLAGGFAPLVWAGSLVDKLAEWYYAGSFKLALAFVVAFAAECLVMHAITPNDARNVPFSNDGPYGAISAKSCMDAPGGGWDDLHWLGFAGPAMGPTLTNALYQGNQMPELLLVMGTVTVIAWAGLRLTTLRGYRRIGMAVTIGQLIYTGALLFLLTFWSHSSEVVEFVNYASALSGVGFVTLLFITFGRQDE